MTLLQIHYLLEVAKTGSMNRAAEKLFVSQPTLTSAIKELEEETGLTIFLRSNRGVSVTPEGRDFLSKAKKLYQEYELLQESYGSGKKIRRKFGISTQHFSFVVKAFVNVVGKLDISDYDFAIRETKTRDIIEDVVTGKSELGVLYRSNFNSRIIDRLLQDNNLEFHHLIDCKAFVYLWECHPLAAKESILFEELKEYPCLSFEQREQDSDYLAEEILIDREYPRQIKANDRATMLNLMRELNGYTLCSGIICNEINGNGYVAIPLMDKDGEIDEAMEIGYLTRNGAALNNISQAIVDELNDYLK